MIFGSIRRWAGEYVLLESRMGNSCGTILYGVKKPLAPAMTPLIELIPGSRESVEGEYPRSWFVRMRMRGLRFLCLPGLLVKEE